MDSAGIYIYIYIYIGMHILGYIFMYIQAGKALETAYKRTVGRGSVAITAVAFVAVCPRGDSIVLPYRQTRPRMSWLDIPLNHIILTQKPLCVNKQKNLGTTQT